MIVNSVADSVVIGFTAGAGILISVNQLRHLFRLDIASDPNFIQTLVKIVTHLPDTHPASFAIGGGTIVRLCPYNG